jgi:predicted Zn-dependent protease
MKKKSTAWLLLTLLGAALASGPTGCSTVPISGRKQINFIPPAQETEIGLAAFQEMKEQVPISKDPTATAIVEKVGHRIAAVADVDMPGAQWEFVAFQSEEMNAFCLPGGKVGVYTGILPVTQDEAGLATVLGHEVAHAVAKHGAERMSEQLLMQTTGQILGAALSGYDPQVQTAASTVYGLGTQLGRSLPHSREQETEADEMGLVYMARAGYDPEAAVAFWERFAQKTAGNEGLWFLRTHPLTPARIENIKAALPRAKAEYKKALEQSR